MKRIASCTIRADGDESLPMLRRRKCLQCKEWFEASGKGRKFCSSRCSGTYSEAKRYEARDLRTYLKFPPEYIEKMCAEIQATWPAERVERKAVEPIRASAEQLFYALKDIINSRQWE